MLSTLKFAEFQVLRDIKHRARIPVKDSHVLVGIADESQEYRERNIFKINGTKIYNLSDKNVFGTSLKWMLERKSRLKVIFFLVCIQDREDPEPRYLKGPCLISRNPVVHPGDGRCYLFCTCSCTVH